MFDGAGIVLTAPAELTTATVALFAKLHPVIVTVVLLCVVPAAGSTEITVGGAWSTTLRALVKTPEQPSGLTTRTAYVPARKVSAGTIAVMLVAETNAACVSCVKPTPPSPPSGAPASIAGAPSRNTFGVATKPEPVIVIGVGLPSNANCGSIVVTAIGAHASAAFTS